LRCPRSLDIRCKGSVFLGIPSRTKRSEPVTHYTLRHGQGGSFSVRLNQHDRGVLRRTHRAIGAIASVEKGQFGNKTTTKAVTLHT